MSGSSASGFASIITAYAYTPNPASACSRVSAHPQASARFHSPKNALQNVRQSGGCLPAGKAACDAQPCRNRHRNRHNWDAGCEEQKIQFKQIPKLSERHGAKLRKFCSFGSYFPFFLLLSAHFPASFFCFQYSKHRNGSKESLRLCACFFTRMVAGLSFFLTIAAVRARFC